MGWFLARGGGVGMWLGVYKRGYDHQSLFIKTQLNNFLGKQISVYL